jgi:CBS domain-containing protein
MNYLAPAAGIDLRIAALVGMAAIFAGASRALLASVVFAFETTRQPLGLLPLLAGCTTSYILSCLRMKHTIMTEKIARRGVRVPTEYAADFLDGVRVGEVALHGVISFTADEKVGTVQSKLAGGAPEFQHQGYPIVDREGKLVGVLTRRDLLGAHADPSRPLRELVRRPGLTVDPEMSLRDAADLMVQHGVGRLIVVKKESPHYPIGIITRGDLLGAHRRRLTETHHAERNIDLIELARRRGTVQRG